MIPCKVCRLPNLKCELVVEILLAEGEVDGVGERLQEDVFKRRRSVLVVDSKGKCVDEMDEAQHVYRRHRSVAVEESSESAKARSGYRVGGSSAQLVCEPVPLDLPDLDHRGFKVRFQ